MLQKVSNRLLDARANNPSGRRDSDQPEVLRKRRVIMRGLRLKVGIDVGRPSPDINAATGEASRCISAGDAEPSLHVQCCMLGFLGSVCSLPPQFAVSMQL